MARDPNKYREDEDLIETDADEDTEDFDGRPEQRGDDEDPTMEEEPAGKEFGRRSQKNSGGQNRN